MVFLSIVHNIFIVNMHNYWLLKLCILHKFCILFRHFSLCQPISGENRPVFFYDFPEYIEYSRAPVL